MKKTIIILAAILLSACQAIPLQAGAEKIRITNTEPSNCKFLGDVTGSQGNAWSGDMTANAVMETGARNDIKNKALIMGGNVIYLLSQRAGTTGSYGYYGGSQRQTNVTLSGNVYSCPE